MVKVNANEIERMKVRPKSINPALEADPGWKAPPFDPTDCVVGSIGRGQDGQPYTVRVTQNGVKFWIELELGDAELEVYNRRLRRPTHTGDGTTNRALPWPMRAPRAPPARNTSQRRSAPSAATAWATGDDDGLTDMEQD